MHRETDGLVARGYDAVADAYAELEGETEWPRLRRLHDLLGRLQPGTRVLDLGCGSGMPAMRAIAEAGHAAVGVDLSREQVERARRNVPAAEVIHATALDVDFEPESFDLVVAFYVIDHLPREAHPELLAKIHRWLRPGAGC